MGIWRTHRPRPVRLNEEVLTPIARILHALPMASLLEHHLVLDFDRPGALARRRIEDQFATNRIKPNRLEFAGPRPFQEHLELVASVEMALDSFPYNGQTNTCECLWMGVPVLTKSGDRFASRVSASIRHRAGLEDWIATSTGDYINPTITKAKDRKALRTLISNQPRPGNNRARIPPPPTLAPLVRCVTFPCHTFPAIAANQCDARSTRH